MPCMFAKTGRGSYTDVSMQARENPPEDFLSQKTDTSYRTVVKKRLHYNKKHSNILYVNFVLKIILTMDAIYIIILISEHKFDLSERMML